MKEEYIEVVIKIPKYYLARPQYYAYLAEFVKKGTILPKHYGRLIDADDLKHELIDKEWITDYDGEGLENIVDDAPTIIKRSDESYDWDF